MAKMTKILGAMALAAGLSALPALAEDLTPETVVATVNGKAVTLGEMIVMRASLPPQYLSLPDDVLFKGILDQMVQQSALEQSVEPTLSKKDRIQIENDRRSAIAHDRRRTERAGRADVTGRADALGARAARTRVFSKQAFQRIDLGLRIGHLHLCVAGLHPALQGMKL